MYGRDWMHRVSTPARQTAYHPQDQSKTNKNGVSLNEIRRHESDSL